MFIAYNLSQLAISFEKMIEMMNSDNVHKDEIILFSPGIAHVVLNPELTGNLYVEIQKNINNMITLLREFLTLALTKKAEGKVIKRENQ